MNFMRYFRAVSVSGWRVDVSCHIPGEIYLAICRPLKSRRWQTQFHAYKMIAFVWLASLLERTGTGGLQAQGHEKGSLAEPEKRTNLQLVPGRDATTNTDVNHEFGVLLIMSKLWRGLQREIQHTTTCQQLMLQRSCSSANVHELTEENKLASDTENGLPSLRQHRLTPPCNAKLMTTVTKNNKKSKVGGDKAETVKTWLMRGFVKVREIANWESEATPYHQKRIAGIQLHQDDHRASVHGIRSNYMDKSIEAKKKVIRMLFVIVAEFFICWAPLHILNTWYLFYPDDVYKYIGSTGISLVQLLAYVSSCCNPITYCFMNRKFRQAFLTAFNCRACCWCDESVHGLTKYNNNGIIKNVQNNSDVSGNDSTVCLGRASMIARSDYLGVSSSTSGTRVAQVIEADPDDETFRYRITWIRPPNCGGSNSASSSLYA
ncbi:hypothetical protein NQ317_000602 [Molorchus minor]|uniref:G-protein coupled receptors family 1 profile domain-containing protein n=1 Tax=Molorchus minor TaxID=1323400 RepID=A0ABQ9J9Q8_9CUCU|nr:hypothetical protein NQ317_000602 [Molorchus minor]